MLTKKSRNEVIMNDYSYYCALWTICYSLNTWNFGAGVLRTKTIKSVVFHNRPLFLCAELTSFCVFTKKAMWHCLLSGKFTFHLNSRPFAVDKSTFEWIDCLHRAMCFHYNYKRQAFLVNTNLSNNSILQQWSYSLRWWTGVSSQADIIWNITTVSLKMMLFSEA